jgi:hypothetical protein
MISGDEFADDIADTARCVCNQLDEDGEACLECLTATFHVVGHLVMCGWVPRTRYVSDDINEVLRRFHADSHK